MTRIGFRLTSAIALLALVHCGQGAPSVCPDSGTTVTYDTFGKSFMATYCVQCHGAARSEKDLRLDTLVLVRAHFRQVESQSGTGTSMPPPESLAPSAGERAQLVEWLSCGAP